jgi:hypothetical protein
MPILVWTSRRYIRTSTSARDAAEVGATVTYRDGWSMTA